MNWRTKAAVAVAAGVAITPLLCAFFPGSEATPVFIPFSAVQSTVQGHADAPRELKRCTAEELADAWPEWVARQDANVRQRVAKGEEDSLANFLLYGTSFTAQARITDAYRASLIEQRGSAATADRQLEATIKQRALDLAQALANPGEDERRLTMSAVANRSGAWPNTAESHPRLAQYLFDNLVHYLDTSRAFAAELASAQHASPQGTSVALAALYRTRGLSTDTSVLVDYALEQALEEIKKEGLIQRGSARRVGIVGPGLDLIDKQGGYDLYPPQSVQPFALIDTLLRHDLVHPDGFRVVTFDISPRVTEHLERAVKKARDGHEYPLHLVLDDAWRWSPGAVSFWQSCGERIGSVAATLPPQNLAGVMTRSVQVRPEWVRKIHPVDLNIVYQHLRLREDERFDILVATNILCYYDAFEQSLAMRNASAMLRPGGLLLATETLAEDPSLDLHRVGSTFVTTSQTGGFSIVWYRRKP